MKFFAIIVIILGLSVDVYAELIDSTEMTSTSRTRRFAPHFVPMQFAGNIGFLSAGIGYENRRQNYQLSIVYGYVPASMGGVRVHSLTAKNTFPIYRFHIDKNRLLAPYAAIGLNVEVGGRSFLRLPDNMPAGYYDFPKSTHLVGSLGLKYKHAMGGNSVDAVEFFAEATTIDAYIWYKTMSDEVKWRQIVSAAFGVNIFLRH